MNVYSLNLLEGVMEASTSFFLHITWSLNQYYISKEKNINNKQHLCWLLGLVWEVND
jgi:hypothetical protein